MLKHDKRAYLIVVADIVSIIICALFALWLRFDFKYTSIPHKTLQTTFIFACVLAVTDVIVYYALRLYHSIWRYASMTEAYRIVIAYIILIPIYIVAWFGFRLPFSVLVLTYIFTFLCCVAVRFSYRFARFEVSKRAKIDHEGIHNVLLIGGGQSAREIIKDIQLGQHHEYSVKAVIDDNQVKWGRDLEGFPVVGGRNAIPETVEKYDIDTIIFAITHISPQNKADILKICSETGCELKTVPGLFEFYSGQLQVTRLREVDINDLLGRDVITVDNREIFASLTGKVVMVTGGGGSIGSELCRQIANASPDKLIIFDIYENTTYDIQQELRREHPDLHLYTLIGDVTDKKRIDTVLEKYHPDIIFHAAAHKHVPLMEDSPNEAIKNNVGGTYVVATSAAEHNVPRFLLISTDKAVNPTNIMGASKRLCEMVIQMCTRKYPNTSYVAVRFGNVLGSNGSVIPLFKRQIAEGGPVTVTDPNIIRYFMTIPEAVSLVLQASYYAEGGEIFVLDMGKPVKIDDMARNLIRLSGLKPDVDIKIVYTGLRPGEKMYEELLMNEEGLKRTRNKLIFIGKPIEMNDEIFEDELLKLVEYSHTEAPDIEEKVAEIVDTYHPRVKRVEV